jgi:SAM-dependent methyltransferase
MLPALESVGWARMNYTDSALDAVTHELLQGGAQVQDLDIAVWRAAFRAYCNLPCYQGDYKRYGGPEFFCFQEKALEHFLSLVLGDPLPGQTVVDVGSCKSVVPEILREIYGATCYEQDLVYPQGVNGTTIGSSASDIPLASNSVDLFTLHCTYEHFEGDADIGFVKECGRLLRPGGKAIILPLYLNASHVNITGETSPEALGQIGWDSDAEHFCAIPEWQNRFGRHYSAKVFRTRVLDTAHRVGLSPTLYRTRSLSSVDPRLWLKWALVFEKTMKA